jgi:hypothetical protein
MTRYFVNANIDKNPLIAWEVYRGILISNDSNKTDFKVPSLWGIKNFIRFETSPLCLRDELMLEKIRRESFPEMVSRLKCLYLFEDEKSAKESESWGSGFNNDYLTEVEIIESNLISKVDPRWITFNLGMENVGDYWMTQYWNGVPYNENNPVWEILFSGRVRVLNDNLRERSFQKMKESDPDSITMLQLARCAAEVNSDMGQCLPYMSYIEPNILHINYIMRDFSNQIEVEKLKRYPDQNKLRSIGRDFFNESKPQRTPDLNRFFISIPMDNEEKILLLKFVLGI